MELDSLHTRESHDKGAWVTVKDQFGKETTLLIHVVGTDSAKWEEIKGRHKRAYMVDASPMSLSEMMAEATLGWKGAQRNKVDIPFSTEEVKKLYDNAPYIREQVDDFFTERGNFTKG